MNNENALEVTNKVILKWDAVGVKLVFDAKVALLRAVEGFITIHGLSGEKLFKAAMTTAYSLNDIFGKEVA